jgi:hypothetical protein
VIGSPALLVLDRGGGGDLLLDFVSDRLADGRLLLPVGELGVEALSSGSFFGSVTGNSFSVSVFLNVSTCSSGGRKRCRPSP